LEHPVESQATGYPQVCEDFLQFLQVNSGIGKGYDDLLSDINQI
jgi:hypothetical protein